MGAVEAADVDAYLARISASRPASPDLDALTALMAAHLRSVPFENLDIHLGRPIELTEGDYVYSCPLNSTPDYSVRVRP